MLPQRLPTVQLMTESAQIESLNNHCKATVQIHMHTCVCKFYNSNTHLITLPFQQQ